MSSWLQIRRVALGSRTGSLGSRESAGRVTCPMPVLSPAETYRFGFDLGKAFPTLFDAEIGSHDLTFAFRLAFAFTLLQD